MSPGLVLPLPTHIWSGLRKGSPDSPMPRCRQVGWKRPSWFRECFWGWRGPKADLFPPGPTTTATYGYVGTRDYTLFPVIPPGSFVQIDPSRRKIETGRCASELERPVYFVEFHDEYACS
jgi:hypothetical protein